MTTKKKENINPETYDKRRNQLFDRMNTGVAIVPSARKTRNTDGLHYPFRPDMDFYYLTGIDEDNVIAVFEKKEQKQIFHLFLEPRDDEQETWSGEMIGLDQAEERFGADKAHTIDTFEGKLSDLVEGHREIYAPVGRYEFLDKQITGALNTLRRNARTRKRCPELIHDLSELVHPLRQTKTPEEIDLHRRAIDLTWKGLMRAMKLCEPGRFEYEIEAVLDEEFRRRGGDGPAFETIVGSGNNATILHYQDNEDRLDNGELVLVDCGASYQYHCADITRTFPVDGTFTEPQRSFYEVVLDGQTELIEHVTPGTSYKELQQRSEELMAEGMIELGLLEGSVDELTSSSRQKQSSSNDTDQPPHKRYYMHKVGHWLGLDTHDVGPYLHFGTEDPSAIELRPGMLLTIEPGLYVPEDAENVPEKFRGLGVRIEDDILVTQDGCEVLSSAVPKQPDELEQLITS